MNIGLKFATFVASLIISSAITYNLYYTGWLIFGPTQYGKPIPCTIVKMHKYSSQYGTEYQIKCKNDKMTHLINEESFNRNKVGMSVSINTDKDYPLSTILLNMLSLFVSLLMLIVLWDLFKTHLLSIVVDRYNV